MDSSVAVEEERNEMNDIALKEDGDDLLELIKKLRGDLKAPPQSDPFPWGQMQLSDAAQGVNFPYPYVPFVSMPPLANIDASIYLQFTPTPSPSPVQF